MDILGINLHQYLIEQNQEYWDRKPILRTRYGDFYRLIAKHLSKLSAGKIVELGSGLGKIHDVIPECIRTDLFPNPWIDQVENAYKLSFVKESRSEDRRVGKERRSRSREDRAIKKKTK